MNAQWLTILNYCETQHQKLSGTFPSVTTKMAGEDVLQRVPLQTSPKTDMMLPQKDSMIDEALRILWTLDSNWSSHMLHALMSYGSSLKVKTDNFVSHKRGSHSTPDITTSKSRQGSLPTTVR